MKIVPSAETGTIGDTPLNWVRIPLTDAAEFVRGVSYTKIEASSEPALGKLPILRANNIGEHLTTNNLVFVPNERIREEQILRTGDVLIATSSGSKSVVGKAAMAEQDFKVGFGAFCAVMRPSGNINHRYFGYFFKTDRYRKTISAFSKGVNINNLKKSYFSEIELPLPPSNEQHRIVAKLDELFSRIEQGEENLKRVRALVKQYRQSVLKAAVTGDLTRDWRKKNAGKGETGTELLTRILAARRTSWEDAELAKMTAKGKPPKDDKWKQKYKEPEPPDMTGPPDLPEGWVWVSLDQLNSVFRNGLSRKPSPEPPGTPILRISAVRPLSVNAGDIRYYQLEQDEDVENFFVSAGNLLFTRYNGSADLVGVCGAYRGNQKILHPDKLIRGELTDADLTLPAFVELCLSAGSSREFVKSQVKTSAGQHGIAGSDLKRTPLPLAPTNEQFEIASEVDAHLSSAGAADRQVDQALAISNRLRQSILRSAFSGKLVPQHSDDEPASMLLDRIVLERTARESIKSKRKRRSNNSKIKEPAK